MNTFTADRAIKKAYLSEVGGNKIVNFQFAPHELKFTEGGTFSDVVRVGEHFTDLFWISGKASKFDVTLFIDRTQESFTPDMQDKDPFINIKRFPNQNPAYNLTDAFSLVQGIALNGDSSSGFQSMFTRGKKGAANQVPASVYSANPDFKQSTFDDSVGVIADLENLLYFVRPKGLQLSTGTINKKGALSITDYNNGRFTPPPKVRFFYGNMWREGYITDVDYTLTVMNKQLVPRRLEAKIVIACIKWGYLQELKTSSIDSNTVLADKVGLNNDTFSTFKKI